MAASALSAIGIAALLFALLLRSSELARVRVKLALAWMLAGVFAPALLWSAWDDARKGRVLVATAEAAGDAYALTRWIGWRDRLRARRDALKAERRAQLAAIRAADAQRAAKHGVLKWTALCMAAWLAVVPLALGTMLMVPFVADAGDGAIAAASAGALALWLGWVWALRETRRHYYLTLGS